MKKNTGSKWVRQDYIGAICFIAIASMIIFSLFQRLNRPHPPFPKDATVAQDAQSSNKVSVQYHFEPTMAK